MTQQYIDFGSFPNDPSAESIREAFQKIQDNFTDLYTNSLKQGVLEVVPGFGLRNEDERISGNLVVYANVANVTIKTTPNSLVVKPELSTSFSNVAVVSDTTPFVIGLANTISTVNGNFSGNIQIANLNVTGVVKSALVPEGNSILDLGSPTNRWRDLWLSGNTIRIGGQSISSSDEGFQISSGLVTGNLSVGTVEADQITGVEIAGPLTTPDQGNITRVGILQGLQVDGNLSSGNISLVGNLDSYAVNASTMNVSGVFTAGTITGNIVLPPGATLDAPGGPSNNMAVMFNDGGKAAAVPGLAYNKTTSLLTIQGNVEGGNVITSGAMSVTKTATVGNLSTGGNVFANTGTVSANSVISLGILSATSTVTGGNLSTSGYLEVAGDASIGNITTTNVNGVKVAVSGNVEGANLVASGILKVDGAANVGSLTTSGLVSAATIATTGNANITGNINTTNGSFITTNGQLAGASLYSSGLADITGDFLGRSNVTAEGILTVVGNSSLGNVTAAGIMNMAAGAKMANTLSIGANLSITATSGDGMIATIAFPTQTFPPFAVGQTIVVQGVTPTGYNTSASGVTVLTCSNTEVTFNSSAIGSMSVAGTVISAGTGLNVVGNVNGGNLNITGILRAGDSNMANINAAGLLSVTGTATAGNLSTAGTLNVTSNANLGNIGTTGLISATGNITGGNLKTGGATIYSNGYISGGNASLGTVVGTLFQGNGANLESINGANVSKVASATDADTAITAGTVSASSQPTITSLGTLTSLTLSGGISGATSISGGNLSASGFFIHSVDAGISATGTSIGSAFVLTKEFNVVTSATASSADSVRLPATVAGLNIVIINASTSPIKVFPPTGSLIDKNLAGASVTIGVDGKLVLYSTSTTQWYSLTSIYA